MDRPRHVPDAARALAAVLAALLIAALLPLAGRAAPATPAPAAATPAPDAATQLHRAIAAVLPPDSGRDVARLSRVSIDPTGDVTVVFAIRSGPDAVAIRTGALADTLTILRAVYHSPVAAQVRTATVLGTYAVASATSTRELPVIRAVLTAQHASRLDPKTTTPDMLPKLLDLWWSYPAFAA